MNLQPALAQARLAFAARDAQAMADNAAAAYRPETGEFTVAFLGDRYQVFYPGGGIKKIGAEREEPLEIQVVLLHYLGQAGPARPENRWISFKELPGGSIYTGPFTNRSILPLVGIFGNRPDELVRAGLLLGGKREQAGDVAVSIPVLPKIPLAFVLWPGDDEFPPSGNVLFDASAPRHLPTEDYAWLPGLALAKMKSLAGI
ncbi:DUF3786 domain-containing protein [Desulfotomaculum copahuensis]|nr:DUF3786 domain-containing protein [Desulfotomaculum copahuensis]